MTLSPEAQAHLARLRAELASVKARLCPCGVPPERCNDHTPTPARTRDADETTTEEPK